MGEPKCRELVRRRACSFDPALLGWDDHLPCEACGTFIADFEMHHRQFRSRGGLWVASNVILLCKTCHLGATDEAPWVRGSGLNVHSWEEPTEVPVKLWWVGLVLLDDDGGYRECG